MRLFSIRKKEKQNQHRILWLHWLFEYFDDRIICILRLGSHNHLYGDLRLQWNQLPDIGVSELPHDEKYQWRKNKHHFYDFPTSLNHYKRATSNRPADTKFVLQPFTTENLHKTIQVFYTHTSWRSIQFILTTHDSPLISKWKHPRNPQPKKDNKNFGKRPASLPSYLGGFPLLLSFNPSLKNAHVIIIVLWLWCTCTPCTFFWG